MRSLTTLVPAVALLVVAACSADAPEATGTTEQHQVSDAASMVQRSDGRFDVTCKDGSQQIVTVADITGNRICGGGTASSGIVIYDPSDSCSTSDAVASVNATTDCNTLPTTRASSMKIDGRCVDISPDSTIREVCNAYKPGAVVVFDPSDSCAAGNAIASFDPTTDCNTLGLQRASSIRIDGRCVDLSPDSTVREACFAYQPGAVTLFDPSDSCGAGNAVASLSQATDCNALSDSQRISSVRVNGRCIDISPDTTLRRACFEYRP